MIDKGLVHIYCGEGKGKTTASVGLSVRASGRGFRVLFVQFFKNAVSGEIEGLSSVKNIETIHAPVTVHRFSKMSESERASAALEYNALLIKVFERCKEGAADMLVLDEVISAYNHDIIDRQLVTDFIRNKPIGLELVMTGRSPAAELVGLADYVSEIKKIKHPYDVGIKARKGIEF